MSRTRGTVRIVIEREVRCAQCGALLETSKGASVILVTPCQCTKVRERSGQYERS